MKFTTEQQKAIGGIRVDGNEVIIRMNGGVLHSNDNARSLCHDLIAALNAPPATDEFETPPRG
jgi:hypothetical protein